MTFMAWHNGYTSFCNDAWHHWNHPLSPASAHSDVIRAFPPESTSYLLHSDACMFPPITSRAPCFFKNRCVSANSNAPSAFKQLQAGASRQPLSLAGRAWAGRWGLGSAHRHLDDRAWRSRAPPSHAHCWAGSVMSHRSRMSRWFWEDKHNFCGDMTRNPSGGDRQPQTCPLTRINTFIKDDIKKKTFN